MRLDALLRAHAYLRVERPPELWPAVAEDVSLVPLLGEMIAIGLSRGSPLGELTLNAANVTVEDDGPVGAGDYVALSVLGAGDWRPEWAWRPGAEMPGGAYASFSRALAAAGVVFAYARQIGGGGSVTVFLRRAAERT